MRYGPFNFMEEYVLRPNCNWISRSLVLLSFPLLFAGTCSDDESNPLEADEFSTQVVLQGPGLADGQCIHLFAPGEDFPCCRVCATQGVIPNRTTLMTLKPGSRYTFRAGRDGEILGSRTCTANGPDRTYVVEWITGQVRCPAGFTE